MNAPVLPVLAPIRERHSPRAFAPLPVSQSELATLFEAARWAASSYNEQPWRFIVAQRSEPGFTALGACLVEANRWALDAPVLLLSIARRTFTRSGSDNRHAWHDVGLALGTMGIQAAAMGLQLHQMAGFAPDQARAALAIPDGFDPVAMIAVGRPGDPALLPDKLRTAETAPRKRHALGDLVFAGRFGRAAPCVTATIPLDTEPLNP